MRSVSFLFRIYMSVLGLDDGDVQLVQLFLRDLAGGVDRTDLF